jgi:tripartite-type tricarboxylate transporter receptor subunit TctC
MNHRQIIGAALALCIAALCQPAIAQSFPSKPVRLVIPFSPGGAADTMGRIIAQKLSDAWGQPVVVDNRPGGATAIAAAFVANSTADGYTLLMAANETLAINQSLFPKLSYNPDRDFSLVRGLFIAKHLLLVHPSLPARNLPELVALLKANPDKYSYGSAGNASTSHLNMEAFKALAGISALHVPYKGAAPAMTDLVAGRVQMMLINISLARPYMNSGRLKGLALAGNTRSLALPDVPTFAEAEFKTFESHAWFGLVAPAATPQAVINKIGDSAAAVVNLPEIRDQKFAEQGLETYALTPAQLAAQVKLESEKFAKLIRQGGITAD